MKKKVYISGKMTGLEEFEFKKLFKDAEMKLIAMGYDVFNPCEIEYNAEDYGGQLITALQELAKCDAIFLLDNYAQSYGAMCEFNFAKGMGLEVMTGESIKEKLVDELHHKLMKTVIDFCNEKGLTSTNEVHFSADCLLSSLQCGSWHPGTDSSLILQEENGNRITSM